MDKTSPLNKLIDTTETLINCNSELNKINKENIRFIKQIHERQEKILICFGKLYKFLNSKNEKTWEEQNHIEEIFDLITHAENNDEQKCEGM